MELTSCDKLKWACSFDTMFRIAYNCWYNGMISNEDKRELHKAFIDCLEIILKLNCRNIDEYNRIMTICNIIKCYI